MSVCVLVNIVAVSTTMPRRKLLENLMRFYFEILSIWYFYQHQSFLFKLSRFVVENLTNCIFLKSGKFIWKWQSLKHNIFKQQKVCWTFSTKFVSKMCKIIDILLKWKMWWKLKSLIENVGKKLNCISEMIGFIVQLVSIFGENSWTKFLNKIIKSSHQYGKFRLCGKFAFYNKHSFIVRWIKFKCNKFVSYLESVIIKFYLQN